VASIRDLLVSTGVSRSFQRINVATTPEKFGQQMATRRLLVPLFSRGSTALKKIAAGVTSAPKIADNVLGNGLIC